MRAALMLIFTCLPFLASADAGPNIGRPKAPCYARFKGIEKLKDVTLYKITDKSGILNLSRIGDSAYILQNNDSIPLNYDDSRQWKGPLKVIAVHTSTGTRLDSASWEADEKNLTITFTGLENGKMKYTVDVTKAVYPYHLFSEDEGNSAAVANRNKMILIALSVIGFLTLGFMLYRNRSASS